MVVRNPRLSRFFFFFFTPLKLVFCVLAVVNFAPIKSSLAVVPWVVCILELLRIASTWTTAKTTSAKKWLYLRVLSLKLC
uniref:Uncharacterized protein n=1 Tax=Ixodes ricinus TaxID=34613 RepID=A0A6B0U5W2_IXORI